MEIKGARVSHAVMTQNVKTIAAREAFALRMKSFAQQIGTLSS